MARNNLSVCLAATLAYEGGYVDHPSDPGGATNMGITHKTLARWRKIAPWTALPKSEVKNLSLAEATRIYDSNYWQAVNAELLAFGVDMVTFDGGVMSGPARSAKWLQRAVGAKQDGNVGPETLRLAGRADQAKVIRQICAYRLSFVQGLSTFKVFGRGWSRRVADIEAKAAAMWLRNGAGWSASKAAEELARQAEKASGAAATNNKGAAGAGGSSILINAGDVALGSGWLWVVAGVALVGAILLLVRASQNKARAEAYGLQSEEQQLDVRAGQ